MERLENVSKREQKEMSLPPAFLSHFQYRQYPGIYHPRFPPFEATHFADFQ